MFLQLSSRSGPSIRAVTRAASAGSIRSITSIASRTLSTTARPFGTANSLMLLGGVAFYAVGTILAARFAEERNMKHIFRQLGN